VFFELARDREQEVFSNVSGDQLSSDGEPVAAVQNTTKLANVATALGALPARSNESMAVSNIVSAWSSSP
jgi:hypothetical protein